MDIYEVISEAKYGNIEDATKQLIDGLSEEIINQDEIDFRPIAAKLIEDPELFTEEEIKRVAVVDFVSNFVRDHKEEIESNYNLLPLTNDPEITKGIDSIKKGEVDNVTKIALARSSSKIEPEVKEQTSKLVDKKFEGYKGDLTESIKSGEEKVQQDPSDASAKEDLESDKESLRVLKAFDQNKEGLKEGISKSTVEEAKKALDDEEFFDAYLPEGKYDEKMKQKTSGVKLSVEDVQTQLEGNPTWTKITSKVPSDEIYELMGKVLAKKNLQTR